MSVNVSGSVDVSPRSCSTQDAIEQRAEPLGCGESEVMAALRADAQACGEILVVNHVTAGGTLDPQPFGHAALLIGRLDWLPDLLEPRHPTELNTTVGSRRSSVGRRSHQSPLSIKVVRGCRAQ